MIWQAALRTRLLTDPAVTALVANRVDWGLRPMGDGLPSIVLIKISDPRPQTLAGFQDRRESRVQVDCRAASDAAASALGSAVIAALALPAAVGGVQFGAANFDPVRGLIEPTETGTVYRESFDVLMMHN